MSPNNGLSTVHAAPQHVASLVTSATLAFEPSDITGAIDLAKILVASKLIPDSLRTPEAVFTVIMVGRELGLTAMQSLRSLHVIKGKPVMSADLMVALTKRAPECEFFRLIESTDTIATYETKRRGDSEPTRMSFTIEQAKVAGLLGNDNWRKFPAAMLRARCSSALCRATYPDLMLGVYETDELAPGGVVPDQSARTVEYEDVGTIVELANEPTDGEIYATIQRAGSAEELTKIYNAAKADADVSEPTLARVVEACKARKAELSKSAA